MTVHEAFDSPQPQPECIGEVFTIEHGEHASENDEHVVENGKQVFEIGSEQQHREHDEMMGGFEAFDSPQEASNSPPPQPESTGEKQHIEQGKRAVGFTSHPTQQVGKDGEVPVGVRRVEEAKNPPQQHEAVTRQGDDRTGSRSKGVLLSRSLGCRRTGEQWHIVRGKHNANSLSNPTTDGGGRQFACSKMKGRGGHHLYPGARGTIQHSRFPSSQLEPRP